MSNKDIQRAEQFFKRSIQSLDKVRGKGIIVDNRGTIIYGVSKEEIEHALTSNSDNPRELMSELEKLKNLKRVTKNQNVGNN